MRPITSDEILALEAPIHRTLVWLIDSIQATKGKGSAGFYHPLCGWSKAYPETTGYLIDTFFDASDVLDLPPLRQVGFDCADWLLSLQMPNGSFRSGIGGKLPPIVFDSGMILFGLLRAWEESGDDTYFTGLTHALWWLDKQMGDDGIWNSHAYVPGYLPSYYAMVVWAMAKVNRHLQHPSLQEKLDHAIEFFIQKVTTALSVKDWSFRTGEPATTHTIAYTLQGMLEAGLLLEHEKAVEQATAIALKMRSLRQKKGKIAGSYDERWEGDYSFTCLTGQAQLSLIFFRLFGLSEKQEFLEEALYLLYATMPCQSKVNRRGWYGGIAGSAPIWGKYQRFRFPNWAAKYYLDALLAARKVGLHL